MANLTAYAQAIPALDPLDSGHPEITAAAVVSGDPLLLHNIIAAAQQYETRKLLRRHHPHLITMDELFEAKRRKRKVESAHLDGPTPAWAQQMQTQMQTQMQQMQTQMQTQLQTQMQQMQTQMQTQMQQMQTRITIESQKSRNFSLRSTADAIAQVSRELDGNTPRDYNQSMWFPADQNQLSQATGQELQELLLFYALPLDARVADRRKRLGNHLGVVL